MTDAYVVIGAGYGDEGKGRVVDYLTMKNTETRTLGVRFNGGAQASHTVVRGSTRHAFSHFSSVTMRGRDTYLDKNFILNPYVFMLEWNELKRKGFAPPRVYVHPDCRVSTPFDMQKNQEEEANRGVNRYGSCGMGIHNTVVRCNKQYTRIRNLTTKESWEDYLTQVKKFYNLEGKEYITRFLEEMEFMWKHIKLVPSEYIYPFYDTVIFEGAQGLQLDENSKNFPHVTHSKTGLTYIQKDLNSYFDSVEVNYVTRCYQTKHGAGPFEHENKLTKWAFIIDNTNVPNPWQGTLRLAPLDTSKLFRIIMEDIMNYPLDKATYQLHVTCLDQIFNDLPVIVDGCITEINKKDFQKDLYTTSIMLGFQGTRFYDKPYN